MLKNSAVRAPVNNRTFGLNDRRKNPWRPFARCTVLAVLQFSVDPRGSADTERRSALPVSLRESGKVLFLDSLIPGHFRGLIFRVFHVPKQLRRPVKRTTNSS